MLRDIPLNLCTEYEMFKKIERGIHGSLGRTEFKSRDNRIEGIFASAEPRALHPSLTAPRGKGGVRALSDIIPDVRSTFRERRI